MKKTRLLCVLFTLVLCFSCSKDVDPIDSPIQAELSGLWLATAYSIEGRTRTVGNKETSYYDFAATAGLFEFSITFIENPDTFDLNGYYYLDHTIITDDGQIYTYNNFNTFDNQGNWEIEGNVLKLIEEDEGREAFISELTDNILILKIHSTSSDTDPQTLTTTSTNKTETFTFVRN